MMSMINKLPKFSDNHKICIVCEGNEEYEYLNRLKELKVWCKQYEILLVNASGNGNIPARYQDLFQNDSYEIILYFVTQIRNLMNSTKILSEKLMRFMVLRMLRMK